MLVSAALRLGDTMYLILMPEICIITVIVKGSVLLEIPSMHKLVVAFAKCQRKKKKLPTSPVLVSMFIKPL